MTAQEAEKQQLLALSDGDTKAFDALFMLYFPKIKTFLSGFLNYEAEAEDLAQDVFIKLWRVRTSLAEVRNLNAYLYRIAKNTLYTYLDQKINLSVENIEDITDAPTIDEVEELVYATELQELIDVAIEHMPEQRKNVFSLSRKQGLSNDEIASLLNISKRTVETHISAALSTLRKVVSALMLF